uniref:Uncharacterized protein n=1 Tax=Phlebotomus papatasi TaxID=29031 RepID=A0A1B0DKT1_PHLPP
MRNVSNEGIDFAEYLLENFVQNYTRIHTSEHITHNVHALLHLAENTESHFKEPCDFKDFNIIRILYGDDGRVST